MMSPSAVTIVGGCGRVGLPLGLALAQAGTSAYAFDVDERTVDAVNAGRMPFAEPGASALLSEMLAAGRFTATTDPGSVSTADVVVIVVGTPVDEHLNPDTSAVVDAIADIAPFLHDDQLLVLRSTVYPGITRSVEKLLAQKGICTEVAFCPERIAEGHALTELHSLPQIVSARTPTAVARATELFALLTDQIVVTEPEEAELAKLFTNAWRYIKFAAANQFFKIANEHGVDFERVRHAVTHEYPRAADLPGAGFAAGPCLFKDTMQLAAFSNNNFMLGHASMLINEGLPQYLVDRMSRRFDLESSTIGILGMAFKADSDDIRSSLAYKLRRVLRQRGARVLCTDPYVSVDDDLVPLEQVLEEADALVIAAPHSSYASLDPRQPVVDIWNLLGGGVVT